MAKGPPLAPVLTAAGRATIAARQKAAAVAKQKASARPGQLNLGATSGPSLATGGAPDAYPAPIQDPWAGAGATAALTKGVTPAHPLGTPPPPKAKPVVTHPHTIQVNPAAIANATPLPNAPVLTAAQQRAQAQKAAAALKAGEGTPYGKGGKPIASRNTAGAPAKVAGKKGGGKPGGRSPVAAPTIDDQVNAALKAELDPQTAAINAGYQQILNELRGQQAKATADAAAQAQTIQGYYGALTPLLAGIAPAVQGGYQDAAAGIAGAAKGFSGALGDTATADAARSAQLLGENAAPAAQTAAAAQAAGTGGGAANALYGIGGYIPSAELSAQGAAAGAAARQLPATYAGVGAQNAAQALGVGTANVADIGTKIGAATTKHADDLRTLMAGVPKARNDLTAAYGTAQRQQAQLDFEERLRASQYGEKVATDRFNQKATAARIGIAQQQANTAANRASRSLDLSTMRTLSEITGQVMGADGKPVLDAHGKPMLTPAGKRAAIAQYKASRPASKGGFTKAQLARISSNAEKMADTQFYGKFAKDGTTVVTPAVQDYQQALKQQLAAGVPLQVAQRALNAFYPVGQEGRPYVPIQARVKLEAAGLPMADPLAPPNAAQQAWMRANGISWSG